MNQLPRWGEIPEEMRQRRQWLLAAPDANGDLKVPSRLSNGRVVKTDNTDPETWMDFNDAASSAYEHSLGLGYCIHYSDPYVCIDLDVKGDHNEQDPAKWTTQQQIDRYWFMVQAFDSYTELSQSGKGLHIWVRGVTKDGARHDGVELYAESRFMVCTGAQLFPGKPIEERQALVDVLYNEVRAHQAAKQKFAELDEREEVESDEQILERARSADNASKFVELYEGRWEQYNFPSNSEADLALMSIFTFYSRADEQCRRLFRGSKLGEREKYGAEKDYHINRLLGLIRGRQAVEDARDAKFAEHGATIAKQISDEAELKAYAASLGAAELNGAGGGLPPVAVQQLAPPPAVGSEASIAWPPGFAGALAGFVYDSAPRPVKEVAIVAALGWLAGVAGKMWNIPGSGLNIYLILVARSAIGKEAMHSGLGALLAKLREAIPSAQEFVDFNDYASGPALVKACATNQSFVNVAGEWGKKLKRLSLDGDRDGPMQQLRTVMTNLYQKSGPASVVGGLTYSDKEKNIASVSGVAYSMIGETTPGTFYDSLTEGMMEDGFLSRFTIVEYTGERPPANYQPVKEPPPAIVEHCIQIMMHQKTLMGNRTPPIQVLRTAEAGEIMLAFDRECDGEINKTADESWRQMWNRAALKMMRIAALLAVGDNPFQPVVTVEQVKWSLDLIRRDIAIMRRRVESGDIGNGDGVRERKIISIIKLFFESAPTAGYKIPEGMREKGIVPRSYLQIRTSRLAPFMNARNGATKSLDEAIKSCIDSGYLMEMDKLKLSEEFGAAGKAYRVISLPNFNID